MSDFLEIARREAPLVVSIPHTGTDIPPDIEGRLVSPWLARKDAASTILPRTSARL